MLGRDGQTGEIWQIREGGTYWGWMDRLGMDGQIGEGWAQWGGMGQIGEGWTNWGGVDILGTDGHIRDGLIDWGRMDRLGRDGQTILTQHHGQRYDFFPGQVRWVPRAIKSLMGHEE